MASSINEALGAPPPISSDLKAGTRNLSADQSILFIRYLRVVLPIDGYVFWVRADLLSPSSVFNSSSFNVTDIDAELAIEQPANTIDAMGSLHYSIQRRQTPTEVISVNRITFTSEHRIEDLDTVGPMSIYIGEYEGQRFAFSERKNYYQQADLYHYVGDAVYPDMATQVIDDPRVLDLRNRVVSNSLPLWLNLNNYAPIYGFGNSIPLFPSYLVPSNIRPPYASIDIKSTESLQGAPILTKRSTHLQLASDRVTVTMVGVRNDRALDFIDCVNQYSVDYGYLGIQNMPMPYDEKRSQEELSIIAQRKSIDFVVSYWQYRINDMARQIICQAVPSFTFS